jgi:hypothetical protein
MNRVTYRERASYSVNNERLLIGQSERRMGIRDVCTTQIGEERGIGVETSAVKNRVSKGFSYLHIFVSFNVSRCA